MQVESIPVDCIRCGNRLRAVSPERVEALAGSMAELGLRTPISVQVIGEFKEADGSITMDVPILIAGLHRVEAAKKLGWEDIDAFVLDGDERDFRLWEIAENLHRADLSDSERRQHLAEWVRITGEKLQSPHGAAVESKRADGRGHRREEAIAAASRDLGFSKDTVARAVAAESLPDAVKAIADEADLGTVKRAAIARQPSQEAQMIAALREKELAETKKANRLTDQLVAERRIEAVKEWLGSRLDITEMHDFGEMLAGICEPLSRALMREAA